MDLRTAIEASVREKQADFVPKAGDSLMVGARLCFVVAVDGERVTLDTDDGQREAWTLADLRGRSIARVDWRAPASRSMTALESAWEVAGARSIPASIRAAYVARWAERAQSPSDAATLRAWVSALVQGQQPVRV